MQWWVVRQRVHVSWLIAGMSASVVAGVVLTQWMSGWNTLAWLSVSLALLGFSLQCRTLYIVPLALIGGALFGLWRGSIDQQQLTMYDKIFDTQVEMTGIVIDDVDTGKSGSMILRIGRLTSQGVLLPGKSWVDTHSNLDIKRGDKVTLGGILRPGFGNFAGVMHRAEIVRVQRPVPGDVARQVRDWFADAVRRAIPDPQAALGIGYLVGQRRSLPPSLDQALQIARLTHIVVASGYNLTILVRMARRLFVKISKYLATVSAAGMIAVFVAMTGASPSMTRAGLVAGLSLAAWYYGRSFHPLVLLPFAAAVTVLIDPAFAWGDLGWQLSFAAFAGVMIVAPLLQRYFYGDVKPGTIRQILGETVSAFVMTVPILVVAFGQVSNVAIIANVLVLPFVPLAMLLTFIAGIGALVVPALSHVIGFPADMVLRYMVAVAEYVSSLPWAVSEVRVEVWAGAIMYGVIGGVAVWLWRVTRYDFRDSNIVE